jgi:protoheme IX farnesyltransferase
MRLLRDYAMLIRPRIATLVLVTVGVGAFLAAAGAPPFWILLHAVLGTALVASGSSALNQLLERDTDALMERTKDRPLPTGRLSPGHVLAFGLVLSAVGLTELALGTNLLAALLAAASLALYVAAYTPLKRRTTLNTAVGAVPGALPPLIGWAAITGSLTPAAWSLFGIVFVWQFPHFLSIAWLNRDDYERAGLKMLPAVGEGLAMTGRQAANYALALVPVSLAPAVLGLAGRPYFLGALYLGLAFLAAVIVFALRPTERSARRVLLTSVVYLPVLFGLLCLERVAA